MNRRPKKGPRVSKLSAVARSLLRRDRGAAPAYAEGFAGTGAPRGARRLSLIVAAVGLLAIFALPSFASAATPTWWHLESGTRPSYIDPGSRTPATPAEPEVQEILIPLGECLGNGATDQGSLKLGVAGLELEQFLTEPCASEIGFAPLTVAGVTATLEGPYGAGGVTVEEETVAGTLKLKVKTKPGVEPITVEGFFGEGIGSAEPTVSITNPGKAEVPATTDGEIYVLAENLGFANLSGALAPVKLKDIVPAGLEAVGIAATEPHSGGDFNERTPIPCSTPTEVAEGKLSCEFKGALIPYDALEMRITVNVEPGVSAVGQNQVSISGGNTAAATATGPIVLSGQPTPFAVHNYEMALEEEGGEPPTHAAAHPFQFTTQITLNQGRDIFPLTSPFKPEVATAGGLAKNVDFNLPPGLIGNPSRVTQCTTAQFFTVPPGFEEQSECPASSAVGVTDVTIHEPANTGTTTIPEPIFNMEPNFGEPARFGFNVIIANSPVFIDTAVRSGNGQDYGITAETKNITQTAAFLSATATFWGVPGDPRHNGQRGWGCFWESRGFPHVPCIANQELHPPVLFSMPTSCTTPMTTNVDVNSWDDRTFVNYPGAFTPSEDLKGCNQVPFGPTIHSEPTSNSATSPTGLRFEIDVDDPGLENAGGFVQSQIKKAVVTLPQGFTTNPSVAEGLKACSQAEYEAATTAEGTGCLNESKVGNVEIQSPLIPTNSEGITPKVTGGLYVARQNENPSKDEKHPNGNLLTIYLIARSPELGVLVRQALKVTPDPVTGQLTTSVDNIPQLPFSKFDLEFKTGQRAPLVTPPTCGTYAVKTLLYPYSEPEVPLPGESSFQITGGPEGGPCPSGTPPFHPALEAGTINNAAGTYSPFYTHITRKDSEQEITRFSIKLPTGVIGKLAGVSECPDAAVAQAKSREVEGGGTVEEQSPSCPKNSEVGHSLVGSGVGNVLAYAPGKLYLAGPYHGSQLSIVSITAAKVGPFDLGTVVVRFALKINPETAEVSVDGANSDPIPHIVDGIPIHLRDIRAYVDRPNFTLNPTSCAKKSTASTILGSGLDFASSSDDVPVTVSSPFQAADCASLGFKPNLALSLKGPTKRGKYPAFKAVLTYPKGSGYANVRKSVVTLPPSEFLAQGHIGTTCTRVQFNAGGGNGEQCPARSVYGHAKATTPLLEEPIEGPVYLRSNGGERQLPDLVAALHSGQINIDLVGFIDSRQKKGSEVSQIRNTFAAVPDAPVTKFTLEMFGGKKGLLQNAPGGSANSICQATHHAISEFTAQNGKIYDTNPVLEAQCGKKGKKKNGKKGGKKGGNGKQSGSSKSGGNK
jgi:hypothetical protein